MNKGKLALEKAVKEHAASEELITEIGPPFFLGSGRTVDELTNFEIMVTEQDFLVEKKTNIYGKSWGAILTVNQFELDDVFQESLYYGSEMIHWEYVHCRAFEFRPEMEDFEQPGGESLRSTSGRKNGFQTAHRELQV